VSQVELSLVDTNWDGENQATLPTHEQIKARSNVLRKQGATMTLYPIIVSNAHLIQHLASYMIPSTKEGIEAWGDVNMMVIAHEFDPRYGSCVVMTNNRCGQFIWDEFHAYGDKRAFVLYTDGTFGDIANGYAMLLFGVMTLTHANGHLWDDLLDERRSPKHHFQVVAMALAKSESAFSFGCGIRGLKRLVFYKAIKF
jgi:hypothetical protein